jgi:urease accessory protein
LLCFTRCGPNTILERSFATNPLKVFNTRGVGRACWVYAATYGGGIVGGDVIHLSVDVRSGAYGVLTTQASTKVYRSLHPASQDLTASVGDKALLAVLPDPVVCFAGAHFSQRQRYELDQRGSLVMVDWMTSGRHAAGERWKFHHYSSRIDIRRAGRRILYDTLLLDDADGSIGERLGVFEICLTAVVTGPLVSDAALSIVHSVSDLGVEKKSNLVTAAWMLPDGGAVLRMSGTSVEQIGAALRERLSFLGNLLGDDPWSRKW